MARMLTLAVVLSGLPNDLPGRRRAVAAAGGDADRILSVLFLEIKPHARPIGPPN